MSFINFSIQRSCYNDPTPVTNPQQKNFDFNTNKTGIVVNSPISQTKIIPPGQAVLLDSTSRVLPANLSTTEFAFSRIYSSQDFIRMRHTGTGTAPLFRAGRIISADATTAVDIIRVSNTAKMISSSAGTPFAFLSGGVVPGDVVYFQQDDDSFSSPFSVDATGEAFTIVDVTATSIVIRDNGSVSEQNGVVLGAGFADVVRVFSSSGVQIGDTLKFNLASAFKTDNKNYILKVEAVTDRDLYFVNPAALLETTASGVAAPFTIYDRLLSFMSIESNGPLKIVLNGTESIELTEYESGSAFLAGTVAATSIHALNETRSDIMVSLQTCSF